MTFQHIPTISSTIFTHEIPFCRQFLLVISLAQPFYPYPISHHHGSALTPREDPEAEEAEDAEEESDRRPLTEGWRRRVLGIIYSVYIYIYT